VLVFVDESGDLGRKLGKGSSGFFTIALVVFQTAEAARTCQGAVEKLQIELGFGVGQEFKFHDDSHRRRLALLSTVTAHDFTCHTFTLNKGASRLTGPGFEYPQAAYKWVCGIALDNAKAFLDEATVVIDGSGNRLFRQQMGTYLRQQLNTRERRHIAKVKIGRSHRDPLLQLADYVAGVTNRHHQAKSGSGTYEGYLRRKRRSTRLWP
jgi:hypothetical protein